MPADADLARLLRRLTVFSALEEDEALDLARRCPALRYEAGMRLFEDGDRAAGAMVVVTGAVEISCRMADGAEVVLSTETAGALVGEMALVDPAPRSATATAVEPTVVLQIDPTTFRGLVSAGHPAATAVLRSIAVQTCARMRRLEDRVARFMATEDDADRVSLARDLRGGGGGR